MIPEKQDKTLFSKLKSNAWFSFNFDGDLESAQEKKIQIMNVY